MTTGIYKITNPRGKVYIGKANWIERRWNEHLNDKCKSSGPKLVNSFKKYGKESHTFTILEEGSKNILERERYYQEKYNSVEKGLNCVYTNTSERPGGVQIICEGCGSTLRRSKSHIRKSNYCSKKCMKDSRTKISTCKNCGKNFTHHLNTNRIYCCRTCYDEYQRGRKVKER